MKPPNEKKTCVENEEILPISNGVYVHDDNDVKSIFLVLYIFSAMLHEISEVHFSFAMPEHMQGKHINYF